MEDTKEKILESTERLIVKKGWNCVTYRMITSEAGVNIAAINYHFGSREDLENALILRIIGPLEKKQKKALKYTIEKAKPGKPKVEEIIRSFLEPVLEFSVKNPNYFEMVKGFFSGVKDESKIRMYFESKKAPVYKLFADTLMEILPDSERDKVMMRFIFMIASSHFLISDVVLDDLIEALDLKVDRKSILNEMISLYSSSFEILRENNKGSEGKK